MPDTDHDPDVVFDLLASSRRRLLLRLLLEHDGAVPLRQLSREIAGHELGTASAAVDSDEIQRVYISLYQTHVPALEQHGIVEYDSTHRVVTLDTRHSEVLPDLAETRPRDRHVAVVFGILTLLLGALATGHAVPGIIVPAIAVAALTGLSAVLLLVVVSVRYADLGVTHDAATFLETLSP